MNAKHTPGPWRLEERPEEGRILILGGKSRRYVAGVQVTQYPRAMGLLEEPERKANARLIAAAPELLEALLKYELPIDTENIDLSRIEFGSEAVERELQRRAAIAKATGEEQ